MSAGCLPAHPGWNDVPAGLFTHWEGEGVSAGGPRMTLGRGKGQKVVLHVMRMGNIYRFSYTLWRRGCPQKVFLLIVGEGMVLLLILDISYIGL